MKTIYILTTILFGSQLVFGQHDLSFSTANIAELSAHRADRLIALGKIDGAFVTRAETIEVTEVSGPAPISYKSIVSQTQPQSGQPIQLELLFDHNGKPLSYNVLPGGVAGPDMHWSPKSAGELIENGMHYVINNRTHPTIAPYYKDFSKLVLKKETLTGIDVGLIQVTATSQNKKLNIYVNLDGSLNSVIVEP